MTIPPVQEKLEFTPGDARWHALRKRALSDLYFFNAVILNYAERVPMRDGPHKLMCRFMERRTGVPAIDEARYQMICVPRGVGKTTLGSQGGLIQRICRDRNISIMLANEKAETAQDILSEIKSQFEQNELLRALFPEVIPEDLSKTTWSATRIIVNRTQSRKEPTIFTVGVGGTVTGMHPDVIVVDDMLSREAAENARTGGRQIMEQLNRWIHQLVPLLNMNAEPMPEIVMIGTRWYYGDSYEHIEEYFGYGETPRRFLLSCKLESGETQTVMVYRVGDLAVFRRAAIEHGRSIFPEKWSLDDLAKMRAGDPELFGANMMNSPADELTATFKNSWLKYYEWVDPDSQLAYTDAGGRHTELVAALDTVAFVDPGGFSAGAGSDRARPAINVVGSKGRLRFHLVAFSENVNYRVAAERLVEFVGRFQVRKVVIELAGQQLAFIDLCKKLVADAGYTVSWQIEKPGMKSKDDRILELEPYFEAGEFYIGRDPSFHEFQQQFSQFPRAARKDLLDSLSYGPRIWRRQQQGGRRSAAELAQADLAAYRTRRGLSTRPN